MSAWKLVYALDRFLQPSAGSAADLAAAIRAGADLRIATAFRHNEHIDPRSECAEWIHEAAEFRATYLLEDRWVAGIMTLRQPIALPDGFGPRPSMSFFLYNQDGSQAIARPHLDGWPASAEPGPSPLDDHSAMPLYRQHDGWDAGTNAPSSNFTYGFEHFRFFVRDEWREVLSHDENGTVGTGSVMELAEAVDRGAEVKVAVRGLCSDLDADGPGHEVFIQTGSNYYYTERKLFIAGTHPLVRVRPSIPLRYASRAWDFGWLMARSDGLVARWLTDPYTLRFDRSEVRCALRWFVR